MHARAPIYLDCQITFGLADARLALSTDQASFDLFAPSEMLRSIQSVLNWIAALRRAPQKLEWLNGTACFGSCTRYVLWCSTFETDSHRRFFDRSFDGGCC